MHEEFTNQEGCKIIFTENELILRKGDLEQSHPYSSLKDLKLSLLGSSLNIIEREMTDYDTNVSFFVKYNKSDKARLQKVLEYAKVRIAEQAKTYIPKAHTYKFDSMYFRYKAKTKEIRAGGQTFPATKITSCKGMSYWQDLAFDKVKITFQADADTYIIEGRTFDSTSNIPFEEFYDNIIRDSKMPTHEKAIALKNKTYVGAELLAKAAIKQSKEPAVKKEKDASVIGRAVIGAAIAGETGAIVGALSAVDKNNKNKK